MGSLYWTGGAGDGSWQTAGNWSTGAIPVDGDDAIFDNGSIPCTAGLTGHAAGNDMLASLTITPSYMGYIGSGATPLTLAGGVTTLSCSGSGQFYKFSFTSTTARLNTTLATTIYHAGGTWTNCYHSGSGGELKVESGVITNYYPTSRSIRCTADSATAFTILQGKIGKLTSARNITTLTDRGGMTIETTGTAAVTSGYIDSGSVWNHLSSGTITLLDVGPGASFPLTGAKKSFTIANTNLWQDGFLNLNPAGITVTYSNPIVYYGFNATVSGSGGGLVIP